MPKGGGEVKADFNEVHGAALQMLSALRRSGIPEDALEYLLAHHLVDLMKWGVTDPLVVHDVMLVLEDDGHKIDRDEMLKYIGFVTQVESMTREVFDTILRDHFDRELTQWQADNPGLYEYLYADTLFDPVVQERLGEELEDATVLLWENEGGQ